MKYIISVILTTFLFSCNTSSNSKSNTYFGGEIINPKSNIVLLLKNEKVIDEILLDENNRFISEYPSLEEGLYTFKHGNEFQYIYFEPADSILIRLNTWDFDESIVFSGLGSSKNEFLINLFLQNEKEEKEMYNFLKLEEEYFEHKLNLLISERNLMFEQFLETQSALSEGFKKLTNAAIRYPLYRLKEIYPYYYRKAHKMAYFPKVSEKFYSFRNSVNLNEEDLVAFYSYQNYIISHLYNLSFDLQEKDSTKNNLTINILNFAEDKIKLEDFKNNIQKKIVVDDFLYSETTCTINEDVLKIFLNYCTDDTYKQQVKNLVSDSNHIKTGKSLTNFDITSYNNDNSKINTIVENKNTLIYFWTTEYMSTDYLVKRVKYLEKQYPYIEFIGINMQNNFGNITTDPNLKQLERKNQFKLTKNSDAYNFLTSNYPRAIIIDKNGIVKNGFTSLNSKNIHQELLKLEK